MKINGDMFFKIISKKYYSLKGRSNFNDDKSTYEKGYCNFLFDNIYNYRIYSYNKIKRKINKAYLLCSHQEKIDELDDFSKGYLDAIKYCYNIINKDVEDLIE